MDKKAKPVIILTGGGSGGHITPLLSLAPELKRLSPESRLIYIGLRGEKITGLEKQLGVFDEHYKVSSGKLRRYHGDSWLKRLVDVRSIALNTRDFFRLISGIFQARRLLRRLKPDVVFSKGGYVVVPVGIAAKLAKVPIVTHDSDVVPGLANRLVGRWAAVHATGMPAGSYDYPSATIRYTGIPVSPLLKPVNQALQAKTKTKLGYHPDDLVLLVGGAGLGSRTLNELVQAAAPELLASHPSLHIIHLTGDQHQSDGQAGYGQLPADQKRRVKVMGFTADFSDYSAAADLIVTRAGATSLAEFAVQHKACVVIPSPWLSGGHQLANAKQLEKEGAAVVVDNHIGAGEFGHLIDDLLSHPAKRAVLAEKLGRQAKPEAAASLAAVILEVADGKASADVQ